MADLHYPTSRPVVMLFDLRSLLVFPRPDMRNISMLADGLVGGLARVTSVGTEILRWEGATRVGQRADHASVEKPRKLRDVMAIGTGYDER